MSGGEWTALGLMAVVGEEIEAIGRRSLLL
jgi:hypothetical protein